MTNLNNKKLNNKDTKQGFMFANKPANGVIIHLNNSIEQILEKHNYPLIIKKLLSEAVISNLLLFSNSKTKGSMTLQFLNNNKNNNYISLISVRCNSKGQMRALVQYDKDKINDNSKQDILEEALKNGSLSVTFQPDNNSSNKRFQSFIPINHGSIAEAMESYFAKSVQNPTKIIIQSEIKDDLTKVSALMLQFMPNPEKPENLDKSENKDIFEELCILAESLLLPGHQDELINTENETMLKKLFFNDDMKIFPQEKLSFFCGCSKSSMERAIISLGEEQALHLIAEEKAQSGNSELVAACEFCLNKYEFDEKFVKKLFKIH
jgi:molecular chaperone Hsp33